MSQNLLHCRFRHADAGVRLVCFPWAGGGSMFYANWGKQFPPYVEVYGVCLPGREYRFGEPCYTDISLVLEEIAREVHSQCSDKPFAFWGHSLGAYLSVLVANLLKVRYDVEPKRLFVSGASAPHSEKRKSGTIDVYSKSDEEIIDYLRKLGGTPIEVLDNPDMMKMFLPALRADYRLVSQVRCEAPDGGWTLSCPVDVFDGKDDTPHDRESWKEVTSGPYLVREMDGGHFYIKEPTNAATVAQYIAQTLK